jgi:hypothetical protein
MHLAIIKAQQDLKYVPKVKTNSEKIGYQKRVRKPALTLVSEVSHGHRLLHIRPSLPH